MAELGFQAVERGTRPSSLKSDSDMSIEMEDRIGQVCRSIDQSRKPVSMESTETSQCNESGTRQGGFCIQSKAFLGIGDGRHGVLQTLAL